MVILGVTGSIGAQTVEVCRHLGRKVMAIAAKRPGADLAEVARVFPDAVVIATGGSQNERAELSDMLPNHTLEFGSDALLGAAGISGCVVVNGVVGAAGLKASEAALASGNRLALANKESLVVAGEVLTRLATKKGQLIPVDSEHSALYQLLAAEPARRLLITASGGPFRGRDRDSLENVTPQEALRHPTWDMGRRISIDSATLANKGLEVIEAHHLFGFDYDDIDVLVHPQSIVHSLIQLADGALIAHLGATDMRIPIQYALTYPERLLPPTEPFSLTGKSLTFEEPDRRTFPALDLAFSAGRMGGGGPAVFNAADEIAVESFLQGRLGFNGIPRLIETCLGKLGAQNIDSVDDALAIDAEARAIALESIAGAC